MLAACGSKTIEPKPPKNRPNDWHLVASQADLEWLQKAVERDPKSVVSVDVAKQEVRFGNRTIKATVPDGPRNQLVNGTWDSTAVLLDAGQAIEATAAKLPYVKGF